MHSQRGYPWKVFLFLWLGGVATSPLLIPYFQGLAQIATEPPDLSGSTWDLVLRLALSNAVVLLVAGGSVDEAPHHEPSLLDRIDGVRRRRREEQESGRDDEQ